MTMLVRKGGAWQTITGAYVFASGAWRQLVAVQVYDGGAWRKVGNFIAPSSGGGGGGGTLSLSLSSTSVSGVGAINNTTVTSHSVTVTPSGGLAPYGYAWSIVTSDGQAYSIDNPTLATTTVTGSGLPMDTTSGCSIHCVVTDSLGATATSGTVAVNLTTRSTL